MEQISAVWRARWAVATVFFVNGTAMGTWAAQIPLIEERLGISHSTLGIALLSMAVGSLVSMPLTGPAIARVGSAAATRLATPALLVSMLLPLLAPSPALLMLALFILGVANGVMDVAMNAHGVTVERRLGRPVMSSLHGMWSLGGLVGAGLAAILLPVLPALGEASLVLAVVGSFGIVALFFLLPAGADGATVSAGLVWPSRATVGLGVLCFLAMTSEGAIMDWAALHLKGSLDLGAGLAATGFAAYSASMAASRFTGDRLRNAVGATRLVRGSAILAAVGMLIAITVPVPVLAILGFALVGLGLANLVPVLFGAAGRISGQAAGTGIAAVATIGYSGFVVGPPFIGFVADATSLTLALGLVMLACLAVAVWAQIVEPRETRAVAA